MINIINLLILIFIIVLFGSYVKHSDKDRLFLYVLTIPFIFYIVNYPLRAVILQMGLVESDLIQDQYNLYTSLIYSLVFFLILYLTYKIRTRRRKVLVEHSITTTNEDNILCNTTYVITVVVFIYRYYNGKLFALYTEETDLYSSFGDNLIIMFDPIKWYCVTLCFILWKCTQNKVRLFQGITIILFILVESIASTAKGPLFYLVILYLFIKNVYSEKIRWLFATFTVVIIIMLSMFSYYLRSFGTVRGEFSTETIVDNIKLVSKISEKDYGVKTGLESVANRLNYLDALAITMEKRDTIDTGIFWFGSLSELLNIVPRFMWENRPLIIFNIFATREIWGDAESVSQTPIGRIAESFLVLGYFGLVYAVFYGYLFALIENKLVTGMITTHLAYYFFLMYYFIIPDSHVVYYWMVVLFTSLVLYSIRLCHRSLMAHSL